MVDVRGDVLRPPHGTTPAAVKSNENQKWDPWSLQKKTVWQNKPGGCKLYSTPILNIYIRLGDTCFNESFKGNLHRMMLSKIQ